MVKRRFCLANLSLFHGSLEVVSSPEFGRGKEYNDYGVGFYCTESEELAKEWACNEGIGGFVNRYALDVSAITVMRLSSEKHAVLSWLALLMQHRDVRAASPVAEAGKAYLREHFLPDTSSADVIVGYRADDSYFSFARAFVNNAISLDQLSRAIRLGNLGEQVVLKSEKAFECIEFIGAETVDPVIWFAKRKRRDEEARAAYREEVARGDISGLFMREILTEGIKDGDARLQ
jgi:hypothetical protein